MDTTTTVPDRFERRHIMLSWQTGSFNHGYRYSPGLTTVISTKAGTHKGATKPALVLTDLPGFRPTPKRHRRRRGYPVRELKGPVMAEATS